MYTWLCKTYGRRYAMHCMCRRNLRNELNGLLAMPGALRLKSWVSCLHLLSTIYVE